MADPVPDPLSAEQRACLDLAHSSQGLVLCTAAPGSGKTRLAAQLLALESQALAICLLQSSAKALNAHGSTTSRTLHSLSLAAFRDAFPGTVLDAKGDRVRELVDRVIHEDLSRQCLGRAGIGSWEAYRTVALGKQARSSKRTKRAKRQRFDPESGGFDLYLKVYPSFLGDLAGLGSSLAEVVDRVLEARRLVLTQLDTCPGAVLQRLLAAIDAALTEAHLVDHDGTLFAAATGRTSIAWPVWLVLDEAQDLNPAQVKLILSALSSGSRVFALGDPDQAIMCWAGAAHDAMALLASQATSAGIPVAHCRLTENYRSTQSILDAAIMALDPTRTAARAVRPDPEPEAVRRMTYSSEADILDFAASLGEPVTVLRHRRIAGRAPSEAVAIKTVHAYKGLEAPVVVVALELRRDGVGDPQFKARRLAYGLLSPVEWEARCEAWRREREIEARRVTYVAMTRACDRLVVTEPA